MRQSPMLNYPVSEYEARMSRAAEKVKQAGLSCIMGTSKAAVCHLTGLRSVIWESKAGTPGLLFLSAEGQYALVNSFTGVDAAMYSTCLERKDFMNYDSSGRSGVATNQLGAIPGHADSAPKRSCDRRRLRLPEREDNRAAHRLNSAGRDADGIPACIFQDAGLHAVVQ